MATNPPNTTYTLTKSGNTLTLTGTNGDKDDITIPTSTGISVTATSSSWSANSPYTQSITATGVTASNNIIIAPGGGMTSAQYDAICDAKMVCTAQAANSITMTCFGTKPTVNIPLSVVILI